MTNRERFKKLMEGDASIDTSPVVEWASWWDKTLLEWEEQGMPKDMNGRQVSNYFGLDCIEQLWLPHYLEECPKPAAHGQEIITDLEDYERIRHLILPEDGALRMKEQIERILPEYESGQTIVWYTLNGFFWFPRELFGIEQHLYSFYDEPELYHRICEDLADWHIRMIDQFAEYIKADFMTFAEDLSYNQGPMLSKEMFYEFLAPYYRKVIPEIKKYGTKVFIDTDGNVEQAIPWFLDVGADGILPLERQAGVDLVKFRKEYPDLLMIGGFDKMCMFRGQDAIRREVERLLPVIRSGRYLLGMDHQTPPGTPIEDYRYLITLLREYGVQACADEGIYSNEKGEENEGKMDLEC